jgi:hypothetical protein
MLDVGFRIEGFGAKRNFESRSSADIKHPVLTVQSLEASRYRLGMPADLTLNKSIKRSSTLVGAGHPLF